MTGIDPEDALVSTEGDEVIIDITDGALARLALYREVVSRGHDGELVIDLRDDALVAGDREPQADPHEAHRSGRPLDLLAGCRLIRLTDRNSPTWEKAEEFVYTNYRELDYCEPSPRGHVEELAPWHDRSTFHVVLDDDDHVVGTARLIHDSYGELPIGRFERNDHVDPDPVAELSSVVVQPNARGMSVVAHLCRSIFFDTLERDANAMVFLLEEGLIQLLRVHYGLPVRHYGESRYYMGGDVTPSGMSMAGHHFIDTARVNPRYWQWMTEWCTPEQVARWQLPIVLVDEDLDAPLPDDAAAEVEVDTAR